MAIGRKLDQIDVVTRLKDLRIPPGNRLHSLTGDPAGFHAIRINDRYRLVFRFDGPDAFDVRCTDSIVKGRRSVSADTALLLEALTRWDAEIVCRGGRDGDYLPSTPTSDILPTMPARRVDQQTLSAPGECPECGAAQAPLTCRQRLELLLAWEVDDEPLRAQHFLTVASFNLQHPAAFTDEATAGLREAFAGYLDGRLTMADIRRRASGAARVYRRAHEVRPSKRCWPMTIDAVAVPEQPTGAAPRVLAWAESIRRSLG